MSHTLLSCCVIGTGFLGIRIIGELARLGVHVNVYDNDVNKLRRVPQILEDQTLELIGMGLCTDSLQGHVHLCESLHNAVKDVEIIFEAIIDNTDVKKWLYQKVTHNCASQTVICSNTLNIDLDEISSESLFKERIIGCRFLIPVYCIPLVEISLSSFTSLQTIERIEGFFQKFGYRVLRKMNNMPRKLTEDEINHYWEVQRGRLRNRHKELSAVQSLDPIKHKAPQCPRDNTQEGSSIRLQHSISADNFPKCNAKYSQMCNSQCKPTCLDNVKPVQSINPDDERLVQSTNDNDERPIQSINPDDERPVQCMSSLTSTLEATLIISSELAQHSCDTVSGFGTYNNQDICRCPDDTSSVQYVSSLVSTPVSTVTTSPEFVQNSTDTGAALVAQTPVQCMSSLKSTPEATLIISSELARHSCDTASGFDDESSVQCVSSLVSTPVSTVTTSPEFVQNSADIGAGLVVQSEHSCVAGSICDTQGNCTYPANQSSLQCENSTDRGHSHENRTPDTPVLKDSTQTDDNARSECVICSEFVIDTVLLPCAHMWLCYECALTLKNTHKDCPACRCRIENIVRVYKP